MAEERPKLNDIDLYNLCEELLGILDCRNLGLLSSHAETIQHKLTKAECLLYCVRHFDSNGNPAPNTLWRYDAWMSNSSRWERVRQKAEEERLQRFVDDANIKQVVFAIMDEYPLDEEHATMLAFKWVKQGRINTLEKLGIKLKTKEDVR